jgi:hypothetical protein
MPPGWLEDNKKFSNTDKEKSKKFKFIKVIIDIPPILDAQISQEIRKKEEIREVTSPLITKMKF